MVRSSLSVRYFALAPPPSRPPSPCPVRSPCDTRAYVHANSPACVRGACACGTPVCTRGYKACHVPAGVLPPGVRSSGPNQPASPDRPIRRPLRLRSLADWPRYFPRLSLFPFDLDIAITPGTRQRDHCARVAKEKSDFISGVACCRNRTVNSLTLG